MSNVFKFDWYQLSLCIIIEKPRHIIVTAFSFPGMGMVDIYMFSWMQKCEGCFANSLNFSETDSPYY